jgi:type II secretory pathway component PulM
VRGRARREFCERLDAEFRRELPAGDPRHEPAGQWRSARGERRRIMLWMIAVVLIIVWLGLW